MAHTLDVPQVVEPTSAASKRKLSLVDHLDELRGRLWRCILTVALTTLVSFTRTHQLIAWLKAPAGAALPRLAFFSPAESLMAYLQVAVTAGIMLSMPVLLYQAWAFIRPALTTREQRLGTIFIGWGSALFGLGIAFAYWMLLPVTLRFLLTFGTPELEPIISVSQYLGFVTTLLLVSGAVFELPLVVFLLASIGIVTPQQLRRQWRVAYLAMVIGAAVLTPTPDAATMLLLTVPMLALYEFSIVVARLAVAMRRPHD